MSQENVDVVRDQFAAVNERDFPRAMGYYADDVELDVGPDVFLSAGTFKGRKAVGQYFGDWFATFKRDYRFDINETRGGGDLVYVSATHHGRGRISGVEAQLETGYLYTVRGGKIVRVELFSTPAAALDASGLQD